MRDLWLQRAGPKGLRQRVSEQACRPLCCLVPLPLLQRPWLWRPLPWLAHAFRCLLPCWWLQPFQRRPCCLATSALLLPRCHLLETLLLHLLLTLPFQAWQICRLSPQTCLRRGSDLVWAAFSAALLPACCGPAAAPLLLAVLLLVCSAQAYLQV